VLDPAMQQFADEMRARPRPRRAENSSRAGRWPQGAMLAELACSYGVGKSTISRL
jgi:hypothetical protein